MRTDVIHYRNGYAIKQNGNTYFSTSHKPFLTEESAWRFAKKLKFKDKDPEFIDAWIPPEILNSTSRNNTANTTTAFSPIVSTATSTTRKPHHRTVNENPHSGSMTAAEQECVIRAYNDVVSSFTSEQLSCLSAMLYWHEQKLAMNTQLDKQANQNAGYDPPNARKHKPRPDSPVTESAFSAETDELDEELNNH